MTESSSVNLIEVKSGRNKRSRSLNAMLSEKDRNRRGFKICEGNIETDRNGVVHLPIYAACFLPESAPPEIPPVTGPTEEEIEERLRGSRTRGSGRCVQIGPTATRRRSTFGRNRSLGTGGPEQKLVKVKETDLTSIGYILEALMLLGFAAAWPFNIARAWKARTAIGVSMQFYVIIEIAYVCGMLSKFAKDDVNYVLGFYILDFALVFVAILIYFRNRRIDALKGRSDHLDRRGAAASREGMRASHPS